jgi:uncharacterized protein (TIGR02099 family)
MFLTILKRLYQQLVLLLIVSVVLLAAYVSAGRQFMPAVSRYASYFETRIVEFTGVPVSVDSLTGSFEGFNPQFSINGLRLLVGATVEDENASALVFDSATIIVDIPRSIWERRWILEDFVIETLEINVEQNEEGSWQLAGFESSESAEVNIEDLFQSFQSVAFLNLQNVGINFLSNTGNTFSVSNGSAAIQNLDDSHFLHVNGNLEETMEQIALSFEVTGNELSDVDGIVHVEFPQADYSALFAGQSISSVNVEELTGGADLWLTIAGGQLASAVSELDLETVSLIGQELSPLTLQNVSGAINVDRNFIEDSWEIALSDMAVNWEDHYWRPFNIFADYAPEQSLSVKADNIDLALISQLAGASGLLDESDSQQLAQYSPGGALENFSLYVPFENAIDQTLLLRTNIASVEFGSVRGSPNMWGMNGYVELDFDQAANLVTGFGEMDSEEFSINLPNVFTEVWDYSYVNGRLDFSVDFSNGQEVKLVSGLLIAESSAVDGHAQFSSTVHRFPNGEREAFLELLVGAERVNAEQKALYLPNGPNIEDNLRQSMQWVDNAVLGGEVYDSGVLFRGSTLAGSSTESKTFQSYYLLKDGEVNFSDEWPNINEMSGYIYTDDNDIDIEVNSGASLNLELGIVIGEVRRNEADENWLSINGQAVGPTASGLNYLQQAPLGERLKNSFSTWQAEGDLAADITVRVPLNIPNREPEVRLNFSVAENDIVIPEYDLEVNQLTGPVIYDSLSGLESSAMSGELFGREVALKLSSQSSDGEIETIFVDAEGAAIKEELIAWPPQSRFVRDVLTEMDGDLNYQAKLSLPQGIATDQSNSLLIDSNFTGAALNLPQPFGKTENESLALHVELQFGERQAVTGTFGDDVQFELNMEEGSVNDGVVYIGSYDAPLAAISDSDAEGIMIIGELDVLVLEEWTAFLSRLSSTSNPSEDLSSAIAFVDVQLDILELYEQELPGVAMRIEGDGQTSSWEIMLDSDSIQGQVNFPFDQTDYLSLDLAYLRLPGDEEEDLNGLSDSDESVALELEEEEVEPVDVLAGIDPRSLPRMHFTTDEFSIGSLPYGAFAFTFEPNSSGAEVNDLVFDFRGLRLGMEGPYVDGSEMDEYAQRFAPSFTWHFDGNEHRSELTGILYADDMAELLTANGYAASFESDNAIFFADLSWPGSPAFFAGSHLSGELDMDIEDGRFLQGSGGQGALRLISILNFDAIMRRGILSNDLVRTGLAYEEITAELNLDDGHVTIEDRLVISGPSSLYQITGELDLEDETILGEMFVTLPLSDNIPWLGLLTANLPLAVGTYLFDQIFGDQVDSLSSAVYTLDGPWENLEPEFKQAFGSPDAPAETVIQ